MQSTRPASGSFDPADVVFFFVILFFIVLGLDYYLLRPIIRRHLAGPLTPRALKLQKRLVRLGAIAAVLFLGCGVSAGSGWIYVSLIIGLPCLVLFFMALGAYPYLARMIE